MPADLDMLVVKCCFVACLADNLDSSFLCELLSVLNYTTDSSFEHGAKVSTACQHPHLQIRKSVIKEIHLILKRKLYLDHQFRLGHTISFNVQELVSTNTFLGIFWSFSSSSCWAHGSFNLFHTSSNSIFCIRRQPCHRFT